MDGCTNYDLVFCAINSLRKKGITNPAQQRAALYKMAQECPKLASQISSFERNLIKQACVYGSVHYDSNTIEKKSYGLYGDAKENINRFVTDAADKVRRASEEAATNAREVIDTAVNEFNRSLGRRSSSLKVLDDVLYNIEQASGDIYANAEKNILPLVDQALYKMYVASGKVIDKSKDSYEKAREIINAATNEYKAVSNNLGTNIGNFYVNNKGKILGGVAVGLPLLAALAYMLRRRGSNKGEEDEEKKASYLKPLLEDKDLVAAINTCDGPAKALALCHELGIESETKIAAVLVSASEPEELTKFAKLISG